MSIRGAYVVVISEMIFIDMEGLSTFVTPLILN